MVNGFSGEIKMVREKIARAKSAGAHSGEWRGSEITRIKDVKTTQVGISRTSEQAKARQLTADRVNPNLKESAKHK
jgi:hypothetical protein